MTEAQTITDLDRVFRQEIFKLTEEYSHQKLQAQTYADYVVALWTQYEREAIRVNGG